MERQLSGASAVRFPDLSVNGLRSALEGTRELYVSGCSAEITQLPEMLDAAEISGSVTGIFSPILNRQSYASALLKRQCRSFFLVPALRKELDQGLVDFCPWSYTEIDDWCAHPGRFDTAVVMVSAPDSNGNYSLGTQVDFFPDFLDNVSQVIGVVNPAMPMTNGHAIPASRFHRLFACEQELLEIPAAKSIADEISVAIAANIAELVPDGATLQIGMGRIPQAVTNALMSHKGLRIHSGLIDDNMMRLEDAGALDRDSPIVTGVAMGSRALYDHVANNNRFAFRPVSHTHTFKVLSEIPCFIAINGALEVDLFGQLNSEFGACRLIASPGGLPDFMRGAKSSLNGMAIVALRAKPGKQGRGGIVAAFDPPGHVTLPASDIDAVVTENGVALLRGKSFDERAHALIAIADAAEQPALISQWSEMRGRALT